MKGKSELIDRLRDESQPFEKSTKRSRFRMILFRIIEFSHALVVCYFMTKGCVCVYFRDLWKSRISLEGFPGAESIIHRSPPRHWPIVIIDY